MRPCGVSLLVVFCLVSSILTKARAEMEAAEPIRIDYRAGPGCPSVGAFERQVFQRALRARSARAGETARTFIVELKVKAGQVEGSLVISEPNGTTIARRVSGHQCDEVAMVLALASALAIDPRAELEPRGNSDAHQPKSSPLSEASADAAEGEHEDEQQTKDDASTPMVVAGPRVGVGTAPTGTFGASLGLFLTTGGGALWGLEAVFAQAASETVLGAVADVRYLVARPRMCPSRFEIGRSVGLSPCAVAEAGVITGRGSDIRFPASESRFWFAFELPLRLDVPLSENWLVALEAGPGFPVTRYRLLFETPKTTIHPIAAVTVAGAVHVGVRF